MGLFGFPCLWSEMLDELANLSMAVLLVCWTGPFDSVGASPYRDVAPPGGLLTRLTSDDLFSPSEIQVFLREIGFSEQIARDLLEAQNEKLKGYFKDLQATVESFIDRPESASVAAAAPPTLKYKAAPLAGIWATAPYLHNGSVPNLYELLLPSNQRTTKFYVGSKEFDPKNVGYQTQQSAGATLLDTTLPGNSNAGHDTYGDFTQEQRWELVEYLKSL